jgi:predicted unusual protein kinase regulating ubiquinone biosynthesis (AarF/ABC1/UbiB family)
MKPTVDAGSLVGELGARILEECDYAKEAENQREFARLFAADDEVHVPAVIDERSSRRVLTTELVDAMRFADFIATASQEAKDRAGAIIQRTCVSSLFRYGVFNGDPHPGNYLFQPDGRVTFLDFGCVRRFDRKFIETWKALGRCIVAGDRASFPERYRAVGLVGNAKAFDYDHQWMAIRHLYRPFIEKDPFFTYTDAYVRKTYDLFLFDNPNDRRTGMPPEFLLLNRITFGLDAVLAKLGATAPWPKHFVETVSAPFEGEGAVHEARPARLSA